jgi:hypothetical protein
MSSRLTFSTDCRTRLRNEAWSQKVSEISMRCRAWRRQWGEHAYSAFGIKGRLQRHTQPKSLPADRLATVDLLPQSPTTSELQRGKVVLYFRSLRVGCWHRRSPVTTFEYGVCRSSSNRTCVLCVRLLYVRCSIPTTRPVRAPRSRHTTALGQVRCAQCMSACR